MKKITLLLFILPLSTVMAIDYTMTTKGLFPNELPVEMPNTTPSLSYPIESQFTYIATSDASRPGYLNSIIDPVFHTKITRITDSTVFGYADPIHAYPKHQSWNSDGKYIKIKNKLIDGNTYNIVKDIKWVGEPRWSYTDPKILFGMSSVSGGWFSKLNVETNQITVLRKFEGYDQVLIGPYEGHISFDDKYVALSAQDGVDLVVIIYNIQDDIVVTQKRFAGYWGRLDWVTISPLGDYVLMNWKPFDLDHQVIDQFDINLNYTRRLSDQGQHGDLGIDENNQEVYVQLEFGSRAGIWSYRLTDGKELRLLPDKYDGGHISCQNYKRPGWCYVSTNQEGYKDVFALKLDGSGKVNRFAQHHQTSSAYGSPNPDGTKALFKSTWDSTSELNSFVIEPNK